LELVDDIGVKAGDASKEELLVATDFLRNTTAFLLNFQEDSEDRVTVNEVRLLDSDQ
jgi:hypothetical protein